jgi:hypothetical protein
MVRSQAREPRHDEREQREAASRNEEANQRNEQPTNDASDARSATEPTEEALERSGAAISDGCEEQEGECETKAVERQQECCASRVAPRCCNAKDGAENNSDARRPRDGEGCSEQEAPEIAASLNHGGCPHAIELWDAQDASEVQAAQHHRKAHRNLQDREKATGGATNISSAHAKCNEDHTEACGEEECVTHARLPSAQSGEPTEICRHDWEDTGREEAQHTRDQCRQGVNAFHQPELLRCADVSQSASG